MNETSNVIPGALSDAEKARLILAHEIGSHVVPISGEPVPGRVKDEATGEWTIVPGRESCRQGFGTWSPVNKPECVVCPHVPVCFARTTNTPPQIISLTRRAASRPAATSAAPANPSKSDRDKKLNPFRTGTPKWMFRRILLSLAEKNVHVMDDAGMYNEATLLGMTWDRGKKPYVSNMVWHYDQTFQKAGPIDADHAPLHGAVRFDRSKGRPPVDSNVGAGNEYVIDVEMVKKFIDSVG